MKSKKPTITIIGAGLSGTYLALLLAKRGYPVRIFERLGKKALLTKTSTRSVNLTFYAYGMKAFKSAGLWDVLSPFVTRLSGSVTYVRRGNNTSKIVSKLASSMPYYTIRREKLLSILLQQASKNPNISLLYNTSLLSIDKRFKTITVKKNTSIKDIFCEVVIGADGLNSVVRSCLQRRQNVHHEQQFSPWKYKQITFSKASVKKLSLQESFMYAWTRKNGLIAAFPNGDGFFTAMLTLECGKENSFERLTSPIRIKRFFQAYFPDLLPVLDDITLSLVSQPQGTFVTMSTTPWHDKDFLVLVGDSAHAFFPFFGQGFSAAFADCLAFVRLLDRYGPQWEKIFPLYQQNRKPHTDVLALLSQESFLQYRREKKADYAAIYNRLESLFHKVIPALFPLSLFELIAHEPTQAAHFFRIQRQKRKMTVLLGMPVLTFAATVLTACWERITLFRRPFQKSITSLFVSPLSSSKRILARSSLKIRR